MSSEQRAIFLTNSDPNITYVGEWTTIDASPFNDSGTWGAPFSPTLHIITTNGGFSFPFHGSSVFVYGTVNVANLTTDPDPTWECFVDGISLGSSNLEGSMENNWELCGDSSFPDGLHELTVNVTSHGMPFYLDTLQYRASPSVSLENTLIAIKFGDPAIDYISGWSSGGPLAGNETSDPNSLVNMTFVGTQLSWYGFLAPGPHNTSSGEWSIDGEPFQSFQVTNSIPDTSNSGGNQLFFKTPILDMDTHELSVKYTGTPDENPLTLQYFLVKNGSFPASSPTSSGGTNGTRPHTSTAPLNPVPPPKKNPSTVGILGGVIGSIVGVAIIIFLVWFKFYRKRNQRPPHIIPFPQLILAPPLQTNQIPKDLTQSQHTSITTVPTKYHSSSINPTSLSTINPASPEAQDMSSSAMTSVPSDNRPLIQTHVHTSNTVSRESRILLRHEDSGLRIRSPVSVEEIEAPPMYTED